MSVAGKWFSELGPMMTLVETGSSITGTYTLFPVTDYPLVGVVDVDGDPNTNGQAVAWVLAWNNASLGNSHSVTAWSGRYQIINGEEEITSLWLLTGEAPTNAGASTTVNQEAFRRAGPSEEAASAAKKRGKISNPFAKS